MRKKFKYQQYFHCFIVCKLVPYAFWFDLTTSNTVTIYSRHLLSRTPKGAAKKFEILNVQDSEKKKKKSILHTRKYINLTCNTLRDKTETKGTLLGEKLKIAWSAKISPCEIK